MSRSALFDGLEGWPQWRRKPGANNSYIDLLA